MITSAIVAGLKANKGWEDLYAELRPPVSKAEFRRLFLEIASEKVAA